MKLVVVGGDAAGMTAAAVARRRDPTLDIVAFERSDHTSYSACGLPYLVAGLVADATSLIARSPEQHRANGIDVRIRHEVVGIDTGARTVQVHDLDAGREHTEDYDRLVIATGSSPRRPPIPGRAAEGVFGIQTIDDGLALERWMRREQPKRAVVIGGGYIGLELAEAMKRRELEVTVVDRNPQPMGSLDPDMGELVARALSGLGVDVRLGCDVAEILVDGRGRARAVALADGDIDADVVVLGLGVVANSDLARDAGIAVGASAGIRVDDHLRTSAPDVWAGGDCAESWHRIAREWRVVPLGTHANQHGRAIGINVTGGDAVFPGVLGTAVTKVCAFEVARTGLTATEARRAGIDHVAATITSTSRASYYPGAAPITVKMVAEHGTGRLLGAQIVGQEGAAKRIDVVAAAIWNEMRADELALVDLAYAPPYAPVWDPVLVAARKVAELA